MITVTIKGTGEAAAKLAQVAEDLTGRDMEHGMKQAAMLVTGDARKLAPVDTGRLRASITPQVETQGRTVKGIVGSNVVYAPYMELGTGVFAGKSGHWPPSAALNVWARRHGFPSGYVVARIIGLRGGLRPRRYLQQAFEQNERGIVDLIGATTAKIVTK